MNAILHPSETRGKAQLEWLESYHSFSFASYFNPERMGFGALRVINDDYIAPSGGFDTHPHQNMEIITIPLCGSIQHEDSIGNKYIIQDGDIQVMSAGTGISHSEFNHSGSETGNFLQIWVNPKELNVSPNYSQKTFEKREYLDKIHLLVSPDGRNNSVSINQNAFFSRVKLSEGKKLVYSKYMATNGIYFFNIEGRFEVSGYNLLRRDGLGMESYNDIEIRAEAMGELLIIEVPLD